MSVGVKLARTDLHEQYVVDDGGVHALFTLDDFHLASTVYPALFPHPYHVLNRLLQVSPIVIEEVIPKHGGRARMRENVRVPLQLFPSRKSPVSLRRAGVMILIEGDRATRRPSGKVPA